MTTKANELFNLLHLHGAYGSRKAIYGYQLAKMIGVKNEKSVQCLATELRREGHIVGASDNGFFFCVTPEEACEYVETLEKKVAGSNHTIRKLWKAIHERWPKDTEPQSLEFQYRKRRPFHNKEEDTTKRK